MTKNLKIALIVAALAFLSVPALSYAASYAYVDNGGDVKMVTAGDWQTAIATAPNIHIHSGVLLLNDPSDFTIVAN